MSENINAGDLTSRETDIPEFLPLLPIDNMVVYPFMIAPIIVGDENSRKMIEEAIRGDRMVGVFTRREDVTATNQSFDEIYEVGTAAAILKMLKIPDGSMRLLLHGVQRIRIKEPIEEIPFLKARIEAIEEPENITQEMEAVVSGIQPLIREVVELAQLPDDLAVAAMNLNEPGKLADLVASNLNLKISEQQEVLELTNVTKRLTRVLSILNREVEKMRVGSKIQNEVRENIDKNQREYVLREQMKAIQRELGESGGATSEMDELRLKLKETKMPEYACETATRELDRLEMIHPSSAEYTVARTYIDWLLALPWEISSEDSIDIKKAQKILDQDHYGLQKVKERIIEHLAVISLRDEIRGPILCFVGPPGVGKTSLGRSIARAMGRKFHRIALGGLRDEAEIRGHRRTYIGAMPGRIIKGIKECETNNPLIMLDEVDKLGSDFRGDPSSALLEVLDPEQNFSFADNYLDMPFDLSKTMFITTANMLDTIPRPLRDRMEIIHLSGYTLREKIEIAKKYLVPRQLENNGITNKQLVIDAKALEKLISDYTREAGVRNLERTIGSVCRKVARMRAEGKNRKVKVTERTLSKYLGPSQFYSDVADRGGIPGVATGLAWTQVGGEILFIEVGASQGKGGLQITGQLGGVMKESAQAAVSYLKTLNGGRNDYTEFLDSHNLHIHVPAGAIPKDGPSAGITMCTAVASLARDIPVKANLAMTGEITIKGNVLPIGGIKEKVLAAHRAGINEIILPMRNKKDMEDVPQEIRKKIKFHFASKMSQVMRHALENEK